MSNVKTAKEWAEEYAEGGNCGGSCCGDNCRDCVLVLIEGALAQERERCAKIVEERGCETTHMCCERVAKFIREG